MSLILTRRPGESVMIGRDIVVTLLSVKGSHCRIGIAAPREVPIDREEIRIKKDRGEPPPRRIG